ncbi:hypothetical protein L7Q71_33135, partial [Pseudomonas aeruginosa]|nr:hypothetical protein [Pseudomonas aeruginosa]
GGGPAGVDARGRLPRGWRPRRHAGTRLAVSGAYPLLDLRRTLGMLQATYPLKVRGVTDYWISLVPA